MMSEIEACRAPDVSKAKTPLVEEYGARPRDPPNNHAGEAPGCPAAQASRPVVANPGDVLPRTLGQFRRHQRIQVVTQQTVVQYSGIPLNRLPSTRQFLP